MASVLVWTKKELKTKLFKHVVITIILLFPCQSSPQTQSTINGNSCVFILFSAQYGRKTFNAFAENDSINPRLNSIFEFILTRKNLHGEYSSCIIENRLDLRKSTKSRMVNSPEKLIISMDNFYLQYVYLDLHIS